MKSEFKIQYLMQNNSEQNNITQRKVIKSNKENKEIFCLLYLSFA